MKAYSQDLRDRAIDLYENEHYSRGKISKLLKIGYQTLSEWIKRYNKTGDYSSKQHLVEGRKAQFTDKEIILDYISKNPDSDGVAIRDAVAPELPMSTFYDTLRRLKITYKKRAQIQTKVREQKG
jgi:transposase